MRTISPVFDIKPYRMTSIVTRPYSTRRKKDIFCTLSPNLLVRKYSLLTPCESLTHLFPFLQHYPAWRVDIKKQRERWKAIKQLSPEKLGELYL